MKKQMKALTLRKLAQILRLLSYRNSWNALDYIIIRKLNLNGLWKYSLDGAEQIPIKILFRHQLQKYSVLADVRQIRIV